MIIKVKIKYIIENQRIIIYRLDGIKYFLSMNLFLETDCLVVFHFTSDSNIVRIEII